MAVSLRVPSTTEVPADALHCCLVLRYEVQNIRITKINIFSASVIICFHISHSLASWWFSIFFLKKSERFWEQSTALNSSKESFPSPSWSEETSLSNGFVEGIPYKMLDIYNTYIYICIYTHTYIYRMWKWRSISNFMGFHGIQIWPRIPDRVPNWLQDNL